MPFGAGNAPDTAARIIGDYLQRKHNITLLITSKPGGSGIPATLETVRARPDGYTISLTSANVLTVVPQYKKCGFTYKDLAPVAQVNVFTMGWGVRADSGIASVQDLMDKAKAERGKYSLASPGAFTAQRFYQMCIRDSITCAWPAPCSRTRKCSSFRRSFRHIEEGRGTLSIGVRPSPFPLQPPAVIESLGPIPRQPHTEAVLLVFFQEDKNR